MTTAAVLLGAMSCPAEQTIHLNLADNSGPTIHGPAGGAGAVWNAWNPSETPLRDSLGNTTNVRFSAAGNGPYGDWWCDIELLSGGIYQEADIAQPVEISGLMPTQTYNLYLASAYSENSPPE